ncbi:MAG TPA: hypothetical protein VFQ35_20355 [Polyangiaceae bacterium]|nr:hypothetical protein [Polyangiaceae bacterium]
MMRKVLGCVLFVCAPGCVGTTGGDAFDFEAFASGPRAADGRAYSFANGRGYSVTLTRARVHVGGVYLNQSVQTQVASNPSCTLSGIYVAEVTSPLEIDVLSPQLQAFSGSGRAISEPAFAGEVWLNSGDVNAVHDSTPVLDAAGSAVKDGTSYPFAASLTIGSNRAKSPSPSTPGAAPICKQRIVSPIPVELTPRRGGHLVIEIDPARMFANVDFADLTPDRDGVFVFEDDDTPGPSLSLYNGLRRSSGVYELRWEP